MSVMGKLFMTMGDINIMDNSETRAVIFNRDLVDDFGLESPYDLVNNGTWTLDIMYEMMKKVSADTNGDGAMDHKDRWGMISEPANMWQHYLGSGEKSISKDDDDLPYLTFNTDRGIAVMEKVHEIITDEQNTILTSHVVNMPNYWVEVLYPMFANDQALFFATAVGNTYKQLREMDSIFGVLPNPKFEETQDEYYNVLSDVWATTVSVPISCQDPDFSAFMLEALAAASVTTNSRTFNEVIFVNKGLRDEESIAMAKLIADTHVFDLGVFNNWYGLYYILSDIGSSESMNFASKYAASESGIIGAMEKTINLYKELDNK